VDYEDAVARIAGMKLSAVSHPFQAETGRLFEQQPIEGKGDLCNIDKANLCFFYTF
jgi:hypothetical protein